jgi:hypothetical protein
MANVVNYLSQIQTGQTIQAVHVNQFVDALTGSVAYDLRVSGSLTVIGPLNATASWATNAINAQSSSKEYIASNSSTNTDYTLVFKNSTGALNNYYELAADGANGPYYNPSSNTLTVPVLSGSSGQFTSITGSLSGSVVGNVIGSASFAVSSSYALTSSYASNGVSTLSVGTFYDTTTQTVVSGASASITLNTPVINDGITVVSNSRLTVTKTGIYNLQFSAQVQTTVGGGPQVFIWLRKNGVDQPYSNTGLDIQNQNHKYVGAWNFVESLTTGDFLELVWYVNGGASAQLVAEAAGPTNGGVAIPSVIVTMTQIK